MDTRKGERHARTEKGSRSVHWALQHLLAAQRSRKLCLVLGAGASADYGLPSWKELTQELAKKFAVKAIETEGKEFSLVYDLLLQARPLQKDVSDVLHRVGAGGYKFGANPKIKTTATREEEGPLRRLAVLAGLIARSDPGRDFHVLTYNMDTLLEQQIAILGGRAISTVGHRAGAQWHLSWMPAGGRKGPRSRRDPSVPEVRVFHPHGIIVPKEVPDGVSKPLRSGHGELIWDLVLGRSDYNELYDDLSDRRNLWQLYAFTQLSCLFYGFSFQDPNVDRLLLQAANSLLAGSAPATPSIWGHFRHVGLLISNDPKERVSGDVVLDRYEERRLEKRNVALRGRGGYRQHNRFLLELLNGMARKA